MIDAHIKLKWAVKHYRHYIPVVAASLTFGSWAVSSLMAEKAEQYRSKLLSINQISDEIERHDELLLKLGNMEKMIFRQRDKVLPKEIEEGSSALREMYYSTEQLEQYYSFRDDWHYLHGNVRKVYEACVAVGAPISITERMQETKTACDNLYYAISDAGIRKDSVVQAETGPTGLSYIDASDDQARRISSAIDDYLKVLSGRETQDAFMKIQNTRLDILAELKLWAQKQAEVIGRWSELLNGIALVLFISGTLASIYATWIEHNEEED